MPESIRTGSSFPSSSNPVYFQLQKLPFTSVYFSRPRAYAEAFTHQVVSVKRVKNSRVASRIWACLNDEDRITLSTQLPTAISATTSKALLRRTHLVAHRNARQPASDDDIVECLIGSYGSVICDKCRKRTSSESKGGKASSEWQARNHVALLLDRRRWKGEAALSGDAGLRSINTKSLGPCVFGISKN